MAQAVKDFFPEITSAGRFYEFGNGAILATMTTRRSSRIVHGRYTVLDMFNYQFVEGSPNTSLRAPFSAVITESPRTGYSGTTKLLERP